MRFVPGNCCCEDAPTRTDCQYRSGTNGETVTDRPSVTIDLTITGTNTPDCGDCDFDVSVTLDCGDSANATLEDCDYSADGINWTRQILYQISYYTLPSGEVGIDVSVRETLRHNGLGIGISTTSWRQKAVYDDFAYTDCDGNSVTDDYGDGDFTVGIATIAGDPPNIGGSPAQEMCDIDVSATFTKN